MTNATVSQDVGQILRESRQSLGIAREAVTRALHIRPHYIEAIETGRMEVLPGKTYVRGYVREYARYLGLDADALLRMFDAKYGAAPTAYFVPTPMSAQSIPSRLVILLCACAMLAILALWRLTYPHASVPDIARNTQYPADFLAGLQKRPSAELDNAWKTCLSRYDPDCFLTLRHSMSAEQEILWHATGISDPASSLP